MLRVCMTAGRVAASHMKLLLSPPPGLFRGLSTHPAAPAVAAAHRTRDEAAGRFAYGLAEPTESPPLDGETAAARGHYTPDGMPHGYERRRLMSERLWMAESTLMRAVGVFEEDRRSFRFALAGTAAALLGLVWAFWPLLKSLFVSQVRPPAGGRGGGGGGRDVATPAVDSA
jgi:hypothetical protein